MKKREEGLCLTWYLLLVMMIASYPQPAALSRVYELTDRFLDTYQSLTPHSNGWLVKFYAPWCHYCRKLEPVYMKLAQKLDELNLPVHVGRADCTKFDTLSTAFHIRGFPTIKFISHDKVIEFSADRSLEQLIDFAKRMTGPKIRTIHDCSQVEKLLNQVPSFMIYFGPSMSKSFQSAADHFHSNLWFFHSPDTCKQFKEGFYSVKGSPEHVHSIRFEEQVTSAADMDTLAERIKSETDEKSSKLVTETNGAEPKERNGAKPRETAEDKATEAIMDFVSKHQFPQFVKVTINNMNNLLSSNNVLVIVLVDEYEPNGKLYTEKDESYKRTLESVALEYFDEDIIFGWSSNLDMINSLTLFNIPSLPAIVVINSTTTQYYIHGQDGPDLRTSEATRTESEARREEDISEAGREGKISSEAKREEKMSSEAKREEKMSSEAKREEKMSSEAKREEKMSSEARISSEKLKDLTKEEVLILIQRIKSGTLPLAGGNDIWTRMKRRSYDGFNNLLSMYKGNPVLTLLIFGLPFTFLSFIVYSTCFSDILDASEAENEEDELDDEDLHEKKD